MNDRVPTPTVAPKPGRTGLFRLWAAWAVAFALPTLSPSALGQDPDYLKQIKPLLQSRCYVCHGALKQKAQLRLDTIPLMLQGGKSGPAIRRGDPTASLLVERVAQTNLDERMPPEHEGEPLSPELVSSLRHWIAAGAPGPVDEKPETDPQDHWAFRPLRRPPVPHVTHSSWVRNPIDAFLAQQHARHGLTPQPQAPDLVLLRRLYLDLIGLPPSPDEIRAFEHDHAPDGYERTVERLLQDPRHGERWARHWMDIWRYSDWWGLGQELRNSQKHIWHWRDWIVEALNTDTPYDEMVRLMLAADELHPSDPAKLRATGFLARNYFLFNRDRWLEETVEHVSKGFLGLSLNCFKCHDHKYDPLSQKDFYRMRAFFEPYQVRLDMIAGETDLTRDGIPRVFDAKLEAPTYLYIRGQETQPDKSAVITPGVPALFSFKELVFRPVPLPPDAWQPERRPGILESHLAAAQRNLRAATDAVSAAKTQLATVEAQAAAGGATNPPTPTPIADLGTLVPPTPQGLTDTFATWDKSRWKDFGGHWEHRPGHLAQKTDGPSWSALRCLTRTPRDFEAHVRFTVVGGSGFRSVGLAFDATAADALQPHAADSEVMVYASASAAESKLQAAFRQGEPWQYPSDARRLQAVELNREHTLRLQVRGTLINASLDGQPVLAWRSPLERRDGALQLVTFDALAEFQEFSVAPLAAGVSLQEPNGQAAEITPIAQAQGNLKLAELALAVARAECVSVESRCVALRAAWAVTDAVGQTNRPGLLTTESHTRQAAIRAERDVASAKAQQALAAAELRAARAPAGQREAVEKEVQTAQESLTQANKNRDAAIAPTETFARLPGAKWTTTRFVHPDKDDPGVIFPPISSGRRSALADWITDARNPLTARVAVNHLWARHMGTPLATPVFELGRKGQAPNHPELLDWLASELIESGWSMKHLHRLIVNSAAYRLSSSLAGGDANQAQDPDNRYGWRRTPIRLEAEVVRDSILALTGTLDPALGGPPVPPASQADSKRRSLYFFHSNNERNLFLTTFDEAGVVECYQRDQSIVPQQALALSNSALVHDAAAVIAAQLSRSHPSGPSEDAADGEFIREAFLTVLGVRANDAQIAASRKALHGWRQSPENHKGIAPTDPARAHFIWALLNHNDFVTLR